MISSPLPIRRLHQLFNTDLKNSTITKLFWFIFKNSRFIHVFHIMIVVLCSVIMLAWNWTFHIVVLWTFCKPFAINLIQFSFSRTCALFLTDTPPVAPRSGCWSIYGTVSPNGTLVQYSISMRRSRWTSYWTSCGKGHVIRWAQQPID